ncbi:hypothetical protein [Natroniella sp. ANB-PHB2]|uniref:hypothetical protein n=1 Tax=Natroniella sp. ANB-PHB2 TaxID=3384444 RepID=UPI0038D42384
MLLLRSNFGKDIILLFVVTIIVSTLLSLVVGNLADFYFGDTVNELLGDYGEYDLALIVDKDLKKEAKRQAQEVIDTKLDGSELVTGIELAGKTNFFIKLADQYQNQETYTRVNDYFEGLPGYNNLSLMTEPRITVQGLQADSGQFLQQKVKALSGVEFSFIDGDKLEVIVTDAELLPSVQEKVEDLMAQYQVLTVRFPIDQQAENLLALGDQLAGAVNEEYQIEAENITKTDFSDLDSLVKTMSEMKNFLDSYATVVEIELEDEADLNLGSQLAIPAQDQEQVILRVTELDGQLARAVITAGDSTEVLGESAYQLADGKLRSKAGSLQINNPRQELAYAVEQMSKLVPQLDAVFARTDNLLTELMEVIAAFEELTKTVEEINYLTTRLDGFGQGEFEIEQLQSTLQSLEDNLANLVTLINRLNYAQSLIIEFQDFLATTQTELRMQSNNLEPTSPYRQQLEELIVNLAELERRVDNNTAEIIEVIDQYNPLLTEVTSWQEDIITVNQVLANLEAGDEERAEALVADLTTGDLFTELNEVQQQSLALDLAELEKEVASLQRLDFEAIVEELEYIQQALPKLRDEEITGSIDLIDQHLSGSVIPGAEISLLVPVEADLKGAELIVEQELGTGLSSYTSQVGIINPDLRGQIYQILSEVKTLLMALTAIISILFSLLFDQTLLINAIRLIESAQNKKQWVDLGSCYGFLIGASSLGVTFYLTGAEIPYIPFYISFLVGGVLGIIAAKKAKAMNEISQNEFRAGQAFGFNYAQIMQEIIIPTSKPGLLKLLNKRKVYF